MAILNKNVINVENNYILIEGLEMSSKIHIFIADAKLLPDIVPVGINRTGRYPHDLGNFLGCHAFIYQRRNFNLGRGEIELIHLFCHRRRDVLEFGCYNAQITAKSAITVNRMQ